ncbi:hypothetical protein GEMRC1_002317 [Eukaryota sp. GEM-RC1]
MTPFDVIWDTVSSSLPPGSLEENSTRPLFYPDQLQFVQRIVDFVSRFVSYEGLPPPLLIEDDDSLRHLLSSLLRLSPPMISVFLYVMTCLIQKDYSLSSECSQLSDAALALIFKYSLLNMLNSQPFDLLQVLIHNISRVSSHFRTLFLTTASSLSQTFPFPISLQDSLPMELATKLPFLCLIHTNSLTFGDFLFTDLVSSLILSDTPLELESDVLSVSGFHQLRKLSLINSDAVIRSILETVNELELVKSSVSVETDLNSVDVLKIEDPVEFSGLIHFPNLLNLTVNNYVLDNAESELLHIQKFSLSQLFISNCSADVSIAVSNLINDLSILNSSEVKILTSPTNLAVDKFYYSCISFQLVQQLCLLSSDSLVVKGFQIELPLLIELKLKNFKTTDFLIFDSFSCNKLSTLEIINSTLNLMSEDSQMSASLSCFLNVSLLKIDHSLIIASSSKTPFSNVRELSIKNFNWQRLYLTDFLSFCPNVSFWVIDITDLFFFYDSLILLPELSSSISLYCCSSRISRSISNCLHRPKILANSLVELIKELIETGEVLQAERFLKHLIDMTSSALTHTLNNQASQLHSQITSLMSKSNDFFED